MWIDAPCSVLAHSSFRIHLSYIVFFICPMNAGLFNLGHVLTFRQRASCILGQAFHYSPENAFYIFNQQLYFII